MQHFWFGVCVLGVIVLLYRFISKHGSHQSRPELDPNALANVRAKKIPAASDIETDGDSAIDFPSASDEEEEEDSAGSDGGSDAPAMTWGKLMNSTAIVDDASTVIAAASSSLVRRLRRTVFGFRLDDPEQDDDATSDVGTAVTDFVVPPPARSVTCTVCN